MQLKGSPEGRVSNYGLDEYSLIIFPAGELNEKIHFECNDSPSSMDLLLKPHICLAELMIKEEMEPTLCRWIQNICNLHPGFSIELNNYSALPPHTIYLRIQDAGPLKQLTKAMTMLDSFIIANDCPPLQVSSKPHLVVASGLSDCAYEEAVHIFSAKSFHEELLVNRIFLIKKDFSGKCKTIHSFILPEAPFLFE